MAEISNAQLLLSLSRIWVGSSKFYHAASSLVATSVPVEDDFCVLAVSSGLLQGKPISTTAFTATGIVHMFLTVGDQC
ncbi:hypothetical protein MLD38_040717 [Melastoma candidum]|nr:hypothetical protein MLD38_040717 [Melastoma candidum]